MIDPTKAQAAALSLFDASCQNVRAMIANRDMLNHEWRPLRDELEKLQDAAHRVVKVNQQIKSLKELIEES